jgi:hypothetical protein
MPTAGGPALCAQRCAAGDELPELVVAHVGAKVSLRDDLSLIRSRSFGVGRVDAHALQRPVQAADVLRIRSRR